MPAYVTSDVPGRIERAAIALFSRQGYHGTSTREIARLADISEVTVFRYFDHKEDIFLSALDASFSILKPRLEIFNHASETRTPETMLQLILSLLLDTATLSPQLIKLVAVAFLELHGKAEEICFAHLTPLLTAISTYLTKSMENGRLRALNPAIVTAGMALTVIAQPGLSKLIMGSTLSQMGGRESIDEYSRFWLSVLIPSRQEPLKSAALVGDQRQAQAL